MAGQSLRAFELFRGVDDAALESLGGLAHWEHFDEGTALWYEGDVAAHFVFVAHGLVQVVKQSPHGQEVVLGIFGPGEGVGNVAAMDEGRYPASAWALSDVTTARLPRDSMVLAFERHPQMMAASHGSLIRNVRTLRTKIELLTAGRIEARLALLFQHLSERFGRAAEDGTLTIPISLSRAALARLVGAREETVIRLMSALRARNWVLTTETGFRVIHPEMLGQLVDGTATVSER